MWNGLLNTIQVALTAWTAWLALQAMRESRKMHRSATRPFVAFTCTFNAESQDKNGVVVELSLRNNGGGVAVLKRFEASLDGRAIASSTAGNVWETILPHLPYSPRATRFWELRGSGPISPDETRDVAHLHFANTSLEPVLQLMERLNFIVEYESADGERFQAELRS